MFDARRNKAVFDKKLIKNCLEIICHVLSLTVYCSGLYNDISNEQIVEGADTMRMLAKEVLAKQTAHQVYQLLLQDGVSPDYEDEQL